MGIRVKWALEMVGQSQKSIGQPCPSMSNEQSQMGMEHTCRCQSQMGIRHQWTKSDEYLTWVDRVRWTSDINRLGQMGITHKNEQSQEDIKHGWTKSEGH